MEVTPANDGLDPAKLPEIAEYVKINKAQFVSCLRSGKFAQKIQTQVNDAQSIGADGTPHTVIITKDGTKYPLKGYVDVTALSNAIRPLLQ
jgi:protein-disulfide isomerase